MPDLIDRNRLAELEKCETDLKRIRELVLTADITVIPHKPTVNTTAQLEELFELLKLTLYIVP